MKREPKMQSGEMKRKKNMGIKFVHPHFLMNYLMKAGKK
jgi:hypothetical protein